METWLTVCLTDKMAGHALESAVYEIYGVLFYKERGN